MGKQGLSTSQKYLIFVWEFSLPIGGICTTVHLKWVGSDTCNCLIYNFDICGYTLY